MTALPSRPDDTRSQLGRAAGIGASTLGALVAVTVAALFLFLTGAERTDRLAWPCGLSQANTNPVKGEEMRSKCIGALLVGVLGSTVYAGDVLATAPTTPPAPTTTILGQSRFDSFRVDARQFLPEWRARLETRGLSDVYTVDNKFAPGASTGWHSHAGPSLILVIAGTVTNYSSDVPNCSGQSYTAGRGFIDPGGRDVHMLQNNGTIPAETIAVQILPADAPRKTPAPQPANCQ